MTNVLKATKKTFTWSVVVLTILWSMGVAALVPLVVNAESCPTLEAGDIFKGDENAAVYIVNSDMERLYFPNAGVYKEWFEDYSGVVSIPQSCVGNYPLTDSAPYGVNHAPGTLVKITSENAVYQVLTGNVVAHITDADVAADLYGDNWATKVHDVNDAFWANYSKTGDDIDSSVLQDGMVVMKSGESTKYQVLDELLYEVDGDLIDTYPVYTVSSGVLGTLEMAGDSVTAASVVEDPTQGGLPEGISAVTGDLSITLASDTPASAYVYKNSTHNYFTKINFTAGDEDVTIDSFVVERAGGPATDAAFSGINVLKEDGTLLSSSYKTLNSDHQVTFTTDVEVPANTTVSLVLLGKMANSTSYSGEVPKLALASVDTDANVTASLPIEGNAMTINTTVTIGVATVTESPDLGTLTEEVGTTDVEFLNVKISNDSGSNINLWINSMRFNNAGSADDDDLDNLELVIDGNVVAESKMVNNYIYFDLSDVAKAEILNGKNETFTLRGDIVGGSGRTFDFDIKKADDIFAYDTTTGCYVTPSAAINSGRTILISRGTLNVSKTNTVQAQNIPENTSDLELASWNFKVQGESITIATIKIDIDVENTVSSSDFTQLKLVNAKTGKAYTGTQDGSDDSTSDKDGSVSFSDSFTLPEGDNEIILMGKLSADAVSADTVQFAIDFSTADTDHLDATGDVTGDAITIGSYAYPSAEVDANLLTITSGALMVTTLSSPPAQTIAAGEDGHHFSTVALNATASSEDVKVSTFTLNVTTTAAETNQIQNITFKVNDTADGSYRTLSTVKSGSTATAGTDELITVTLPTADYIIIEKGTTVNMQIYADVSAGASEDDIFQLFISNSANDQSETSTVTAEGVLTGATVTPTYSSASGNAMTIGASGGQLEVALASDTPSAAIMAADTDVTLASFRFLATTTEDVELDYLYVTQVDTTSATSSYKNYDYIWFEDADGNEIGGTRMSPTNTNPYIDFADEAFIVEADGSSEILYLKANLAAIGSCASLTCTGANGTPGHKLGYKINSTASDVVATGHASGSGTTEFAGSVAPTGNTHYMYKAYPVVSKKSITTSLANGTRDLFKFEVSAVNGDIGLGGFTFDINTTTASIAAGTCYLYDVTESAEEQVNDTGGCTVAAANNATNVNKTSTTHYTGGSGLVVKFVGHGDDWDTTQTGNEITVSPSKPRTFILRGNITGAASGASVSTGLAGDAGTIIAATGGGATNMIAAASIERIEDRDDFIWSDKNDNGHTHATTDWTNGFLVSGLNSNTSTLETVAYGS